MSLCHWSPVLVTLLTAVTEYLIKPTYGQKERKVYFGQEFESAACHGMEVTETGT